MESNQLETNWNNNQLRVSNMQKRWLRYVVAWALALMLGSGLLVVSVASAAAALTETKLTASDGAKDDVFSFSVATAEDRVVVGASADDDNGRNSGSVYLYEPDGMGSWAETKLTASDGVSYDIYGFAVATAGDRIVVGAYMDDDNGSESGSVYVYEADGMGGWTETKLTASDGAYGDWYGRSVAIAGDRIVVGAYQDDDNGSRSGSAYIYDSDGTGGWTETKLTASDGASGDSFGQSVATVGDRIVVGADGDDDNGSNAGSLYVYEPDGLGGWTETKLTASDGSSYEFFGRSVATAGDRIVTGAYRDSDIGFGSGAVYIYEPDGLGGWTETKLTASDGAGGDSFGYTVAAAGENFVVGAYRDDDSGSSSGSAYLYEPDGMGGWTETKLTASDGAAGDSFGYSLAIAGERIVAGAWLDDDNGDASGSAYVYEPDSDSDGFSDTVDNCPATPNPDQADFDGDGQGDACDPDIDNDGVLNEGDLCAETLLTADAPPQPKKNRFFVNAAGEFVDGEGTFSGYTIADTGGCSSQQIIVEAGLGGGHAEFGISRSALEAWIASVP